MGSEARTNLTNVPFTLVTWFEPDPQHDASAQVILQCQNGMAIIAPRRLYEIWATCALSNADLTNPHHARYQLTMHPSGAATCSCPDWLKRGGACKHLRALWQIILHWIKTGALVTPHIYHFPELLSDAQDIEARNRTWYGPHYLNSVTTFSNMKNPPQLEPRGSVGNSALQITECPLDPPPMSPEKSPINHAIENQILFQAYAGDEITIDWKNGDTLECESQGDSDSVLSDSESDIDHIKPTQSIVNSTNFTL